MRFVRWLKDRGGPKEDAGLIAWRKSWNEAANALDGSGADALASALDRLSLPEEEIEIEREMLDALQELASLVSAVGAGGLPEIATGHRIVLGESCHFTAPASMPDEASQPAGRLLLTGRRAVFAGGPVVRTAAWHGVTECVRFERDLILLRGDKGTLHRFRCNTYGDALRAAFVARELQRASRHGAAL
jgi:hypothetical protein